MEYILYLIIAVVIAFIFSQTRIFSIQDKNIIEGTVGWVLVIYGLILSFSMINFYNRYITMRDSFITEATNLQLIYDFFTQLTPSKEIDEINESILNYAKHIKNINGENYKFKIEQSDELYNVMNDKILKYINNNNNIPFATNILMRMGTNIRIKKLIDEIDAGQYYINILCFLLIFISIPLWLTTVKNRTIQFFIDLCIYIVILTVIYLCEILNNPFIESPLSFNLSMYSDLVKRIEKK